MVKFRNTIYQYIVNWPNIFINYRGHPLSTGISSHLEAKLRDWVEKQAEGVRTPSSSHFQVTLLPSPACLPKSKCKHACKQNFEEQKVMVYDGLERRSGYGLDLRYFDSNQSWVMNSKCMSWLSFIFFLNPFFFSSTESKNLFRKPILNYE